MTLFFQKRNVKTNVRLILFPFVLCILLLLLQNLLNKQFDKAKNKCGCICTKTQGEQCLEKQCGVQYSDVDQVGTWLMILLLTLLNGLHCCKLLIHNTALLEQIFFRFLIFQTPYAETMAHVPSLCSLLALISLSEKVYNKVKYIYHPFKFNWISSPFSFSSITFSFTLSLYVYVRMKLYLASLAVKICPAIKTLGIDGMNFHIVLRLMSRVLIYFRCLMSSQSCFLSFIVLSGNMIPSTFRINNTDVMDSLATNVLVSQRLFNFEQIILLFPFM
jgi:hypothetical protein